MTIHEFMKDKINEIKVIISIDIEENTFDSHDFIEKFMKKYELDYIKFLTKYDNNPFRNLNSQIAIFLSKNASELNIQKQGKSKSESVFGLNVDNERWLKI